MRLKANEFSSYELTQAEEVQGWAVSPTTQAVLRNELAKITLEIVNVRAEGKDKEEEERKHLAYLQGQKDILVHLLANIAMYSEDLALLVAEETPAEDLRQ